MPIAITCPTCGATGNAPDHFLNKQVRCSKCKNPFTVKAPSAQGPPPLPAGESARPIQEIDVEAVQELEIIEDIEELKEGKKMARRRRDDDDYDDDIDDDDDYDDRPIRKKSIKRKRGASGFVDFLMFRWMITPAVLMVIFWFGTVVSIVFGIVAGVMALINAPGAGAKITGAAMGLATMVFGPVVLRIYIEMIIVFFKIFYTLNDIKKELEDQR